MKFSKAGFTLMELLVYMGIVGIVVVIAGEAFSNSTKFRIRTDNMIKATQEAENVGMLFKEDVGQLGTKSSREAGNADAGSYYGVKFTEVNGHVYMDPENIDANKRDSSSFLLEKIKDFSRLTFRRMRYDDDGHYQAVEEVQWFVQGDALMRSCKIIDKLTGLTIPSDDPCAENAAAVTMATGVKTFTVEAANPGAKENLTQIFPPDNLHEFRLVPRDMESGYVAAKVTNSANVENAGGTTLVLSKFRSNYRNSDDSDGGIVVVGERVINQFIAIKNETSAETNWKMLCDSYGKMTLRPDTVYEIAFELSSVEEDDKSLMFVPGTDHMSVGFRKAGSGDYAKKEDVILLRDFMFFPPLDADNGAGKRTMRFTVPERIDNVCLAFTFACFSPMVSQGKVTIKNLKVSMVPSSNYKFDGFDPEAGTNKKEKKNVKALKLRLQVSRGAKNNGKGETGEVDLIVAIPSNGPRD
jgi:prepilin-type N-terminal cleavage/methylation domain-containing protein